MDELPEILTHGIKSTADGYVRLAQAVFVQAFQDAQGCDLTRRTQARRWLRQAGQEWLDMIGAGDVYEAIMDALKPRRRYR